jgi:GMP synthase (glutamine-hydrolysing)
MKILIVQIRPEDEAADNELASFMTLGGLSEHEVHRIQVDRVPMPAISLNDYNGVIVGGGPANISDSNKGPDTLRMERDIANLLDHVVERDMPYLGACYGFGALLTHQGGIVTKEKYSEDVGAFTVNLNEAAATDQLTKGLPTSFRVFGGHKEAAQHLPDYVTLLASSEGCPVQMIRIKNNIYGTQFHPELDTNGIILRINVYKHAGYFPAEDAQKLIEQVKNETVTVPAKILQNFIALVRNYES